MENLLDLYMKPYNPKCPVICIDERPCQLIDDIVVPIPMKPGNPKKIDYHYKRNGTCSIFVAVEPLTGFRHIQVKKQRTKKDYCEFMKEIAEIFSEAEKIIIVQDNLNTHDPSAFYENMSAANAFKLTNRFEMHYTPKHASWLNMAEIEISALSKQCLDRRISDIKTMKKEVKAWTKDRNVNQIKITWSFTTNIARTKLEKDYIIIRK